jgi:hypothetical protein
MDVTDGTRNLPELTLLGLPVVSWAFSQQNTWVLPFADYYSIVGHFFPQLQPRMPPVRPNSPPFNCLSLYFL